jgi:hypothetical protein
VKEEGAAVSIAAGDETTLIAPEFYAYKNAAKTALGLFGDAKASANGISAEGGPVEAIVEAGQASIAANGKEGVRTLELPGDWKAVHSLTRAGGKWTLRYAGGEPLKLVLQK